jgi:MFS family permease
MTPGPGVRDERVGGVMYTTIRGVVPDAAKRRGSGAGRRPGTGRTATSGTVILLGLTSLFTDVSSEMVASVLPVYLTLQLGFSPLLYGVVDGLYHGVTAAVRLAAGHVSDRWRRPKAVATFGYGLSAVAKLALLPVTSFSGVTAVITADRAGKGIRTAPRDAMIAASSSSESLGRSFGVHRALDTVGAMVGPLLAFILLTALPGDFDAVFITSFCFAVLGVSVIALLVRDPVAAVPAHPTVSAPVRPRVRDSLSLATRPNVRRILVCAGLLSVLTVSDGFLYLSLQRREDLASHVVPLLFVATSVSYMLLAVPVGRIADRVGRVRVFLIGHVVLLCAYVVVLGPASGPPVVVGALGLLGAYYAATDGVLAALTSATVPEELRSSGLALVQTVFALGRLGSAVLFGALWTIVGWEAALVTFGVALAVGVLAATVVLRQVEERRSS